VLNEKGLRLLVKTPSSTWALAPSGAKDMLVKLNGEEFPLKLADAQQTLIAPYDTGFKTGVKLKLSQWRHEKRALDLTLYLTIAFEGRDEDLVFEAAADEHSAVLRQLDWPTAMDAREVEHTILSNGRGNLLPRAWPKEFFPIRTIKDGKVSTNDHSVLQSHVIESWSMSWWGFQKGKSAMMVIVETSDGASFQLEHPAGGPTVMGPRWLATLGRFGYPRVCRFCFFGEGNYVTLAKRYRRYVMDTGLFVSLKEKIARTPILADMIGTPQTRVGILRNRKKDSDRYDTENPTNNYSLTTFDERARQLREMKARGIERTLVFVSAARGRGWLGRNETACGHLPRTRLSLYFPRPVS
jgi:hypothetical protein